MHLIALVVYLGYVDRGSNTQSHAMRKFASVIPTINSPLHRNIRGIEKARLLSMYIPVNVTGDHDTFSDALYQRFFTRRASLHSSGRSTVDVGLVGSRHEKFETYVKEAERRGKCGTDPKIVQLCNGGIIMFAADQQDNLVCCIPKSCSRYCSIFEYKYRQPCSEDLYIRCRPVLSRTVRLVEPRIEDFDSHRALALVPRACTN